MRQKKLEISIVSDSVEIDLYEIDLKCFLTYRTTLLKGHCIASDSADTIRMILI